MPRLVLFFLPFTVRVSKTSLLKFSTDFFPRFAHLDLSYQWLFVISTYVLIGCRDHDIESKSALKQAGWVAFAIILLPYFTVFGVECGEVVELA